MSERTVFEPLLAREKREAISKAALQQYHDNVAVFVAFQWHADTDPQIVHHYMRQCALAIELEMRNRREERQLGSAVSDCAWAFELAAEVQRRDDLLLAEQDAKNREERVRNLRYLALYRKLLRLQRCDGDEPSFVKDMAVAQEFFFSCVAVSRALQTMLASKRPCLGFSRWPAHVRVQQRAMISLMNCLLSLEPHRRSLSPELYMEQVRASLLSATTLV